MKAHRSRVIDSELHTELTVMGAVLLEGPKAVGKTQSASQVAQTTYRLDMDRAARTMFDADPGLLFDAPTPILFDEWQELPELWNAVRRAVDEHSERGLYLLTGSATPRDNARLHPGAGRISRIMMRPMSLFESGHSTGEVSLASVLAGHTPQATPSTMSVREIIERIVIGGWPEAVELDENLARRWMGNYLKNVAEVDIPAMGPRRQPANLKRLLSALARGVGTPLKRAPLEVEAGGESGPIASETLNNYLDALERLFLIETLPAWRPHMRSPSQLRTSAVHYFVDPSIGPAALGIGTSELLADLPAAGFHFEALVMRDIRVYSQALDASLSSWRDTKLNKEVDLIIELPNGSWAAVEVKLGENATDAAAASLLSFAEKVDTARHGKPVALIVINAGRYTYRRPDGVLVIPISVLGP
ncbi:putative AAA+ superfamily ATPase [Aurantimicrobium minutum]|uniref:ATP-binding protein n=1 Tax=Aurantimicrobium minutum TaxID=708131 RepID=UPI0024743B48|nr:DUF4143 domain-containing protein [Aurantimicrobium minutum]MDH6277607.1 putative AAA+ superfamily ATPase [Aurantimicrobium minutum]